MNRNTVSHFATLPANIDIKRSRFDRSTSYKTTFNTGDLIPFFCDEVLPGDTFEVDTSLVCRMSTFQKPVMDDLNLDIYYYFVPCRLLWEHWEEFCGANKTDFWTQETEYVIPKIKAPLGGWQKGTIADYFGIPTQVENIEVNALPFRAYALIYNEWFRDENLTTPAHIYFDDSDRNGSNGTDYVSDVELGAMPCKAAKYFDFYTSALPEPQKGSEILLPLGTEAPVFGSGSYFLIDGQGNNFQLVTGGTANPGTIVPSSLYSSSGNATTTAANTPMQIAPGAFTVDLSNATAASINDLRLAFAMQRFAERSARFGTRYTEIIKGFFGTTSPDSRLQRPEYLGGKRIPINVNQVLQTSATGDVGTPQGNTAAFSLTADMSSNFTQSFTEHGYIIGLAVVRTEHTYQQGLERMWSRTDKFSMYWPTFANLGETPIYTKEIFATGTEDDDTVFGYQEAWAEYRYKPSKVTGAFRSNYAESLDIWHFADDYASAPRLSNEWIQETPVNVDRTLAVTSQLEDQFLMDMYIRNWCTRPMPLYSIPGLIDHN